jgi:hypothetical protein
LDDQTMSRPHSRNRMIAPLLLGATRGALYAACTFFLS